MRAITVTYGQTLIDIALQEYGCYEAVTLLMEDNQLGLGELLEPGTSILIRDVIPDITGTNLLILAQYKKAGIVKKGKPQGRKINSGFELPVSFGGGDFDDDDFNPFNYD